MGRVQHSAHLIFPIYSRNGQVLVEFDGLDELFYRVLVVT
jgi:hypothetical protein